MKNYKNSNGETYYDYYSNNFSNQYIYNNKKLSEVKKLAEDLDKIKVTNSRGKEESLCFGLGCIQWTGTRCIDLINIYLEVTNNSENITIDQTMQAEAIMISRELNGSYAEVYSHWKSQCSDLCSSDAAYQAGYCILIGCGLNPHWLTHDLPDDLKKWEDTAITRGQNAKKLYNYLLS